jgi:hypothetical protein
MGEEWRTLRNPIRGPIISVGKHLMHIFDIVKNSDIIRCRCGIKRSAMRDSDSS